MKKVILVSCTLLITTISFCQSKLNLIGQTFEKEKTNDKNFVKIEFLSPNTANYIMFGTLFSGNSYKDVCPCSYSSTGTTIKIKCICDDKEIYPDSIEHNFTYDFKTNTLKDIDYNHIWKQK